MVYLSITAIITAFIILYLDATSKNRRRERLQSIRNAWGTPRTDDRNFHRIGRYAEQSKGKMPHKLSQQTLDDIDFQQLFSFIDRTGSAVGQQFLFRQVLYPFHSIADLARLHSLANVMTHDADSREEIQGELMKLSHPGAYNLCSLVDLQVSRRPSWFKYLYGTLLLIPVLLILSSKFPVCFALLCIPVTINTLVHYWHRSRMGFSFSSFAELSTLMDVARKIVSRSGFENVAVQESLQVLKAFKWKLILLNPGRATMKDDLSQFGYYLNELANGILLIEVFTVLSLERVLEKRKGAVATLFHFVGEIDTSVSIASLRADASMTCVPRFVERRKEMSASELYHPLIPNCVKNDIYINGKGALITGSNMSGKTTFLRSFVINSILAQSIYTCFAKEFATPFVRQFSSIRIDDNLFQGRSYFFEEVNVIGLFIEEMQSGSQNLFILDEVFKGTNSVEGTALGKSILSYLNRGDNIVLVSTHDMELSEMLRDEYDVYHFSETIENGKLHFDHTLKPGPLKTRNAIRLLELGNFPTEITSEARALTSGFSLRKINGEG